MKPPRAAWVAPPSLAFGVPQGGWPWGSWAPLPSPAPLTCSSRGPLPHAGCAGVDTLPTLLAARLLRGSGTHCVQGLLVHLIGPRSREELELRAEAPGVGQCDSPGCGLTHHVAAKADELLVEGQLPKDPTGSCSGPAACPARGVGPCGSPGDRWPLQQGHHPPVTCSPQGPWGAWLFFPYIWLQAG